jgi:gas vesicle protein GvpL/GvpF
VKRKDSAAPGVATYAYCLVQSPTAPDPAGAPAGLPGTRRPRALPLEPGLWLLAADAPLSEYDGAAIDARLSDLSWVSERALAHEAMVEHFAASHPVLPLKLFTLFTNDERALAGLRERSGEIARTFRRIGGRVEWGVRVLLQDSPLHQGTALPAGEGSGGEAFSGKGFLQRKKKEQDSARSLTAQVRAEVNRAFEELAQRADAARRREPVAAAGETGARLLLDAAFLVPRGDGTPFEEAVRRWADHLAALSCELTLTGPWPPYNFIEEPE